MTAMHLIPQLASLVYNASTCLIRFLYVRSSLQVNIQEVYRRNQFTLMFILICEGINVFNIVSALYYRPDVPFVLYRACLDPWDDFAIPLMRVMPLNQLVLYICDLVIICSNLFLYRFLKQNTINNSGKSVQGSLLSLVEVERGLALIGREIKSVEMF